MEIIYQIFAPYKPCTPQVAKHQSANSRPWRDFRLLWSLLLIFVLCNRRAAKDLSPARQPKVLERLHPAAKDFGVNRTGDREIQIRVSLGLRDRQYRLLSDQYNQGPMQNTHCPSNSNLHAHRCWSIRGIIRTTLPPQKTTPDAPCSYSAVQNKTGK